MVMMIFNGDGVWYLPCYFTIYYASGATLGGALKLESGYGDVRPWRPRFHTSPVVRKGLIQAKVSGHKTPFWENVEISASTVSIFAQILAHKPPNLEIFSSQAPLFQR